MAGDMKYGRLFTEADVIAICNQIEMRREELRGSQKLIMDLADEMHLTFPADEPLFLLRGEDGPAAADAVAAYGRSLPGVRPVEERVRVANAWDALRTWEKR
jgi:hypothetical protein